MMMMEDNEATFRMKQQQQNHHDPYPNLRGSHNSTNSDRRTSISTTQSAPFSLPPSSNIYQMYQATPPKEQERQRTLSLSLTDKTREMNYDDFIMNQERRDFSSSYTSTNISDSNIAIPVERRGRLQDDDSDDQLLERRQQQQKQSSLPPSRRASNNRSSPILSEKERQQQQRFAPTTISKQRQQPKITPTDSKQTVVEEKNKQKNLPSSKDYFATALAKSKMSLITSKSKIVGKQLASATPDVHPSEREEERVYPGAVRVKGINHTSNPYADKEDDYRNTTMDDDDNDTVVGGSSLSSRHNRRVHQLRYSDREEQGQSSLQEVEEVTETVLLRRETTSSSMSSLTTIQSHFNNCSNNNSTSNINENTPPSCLRREDTAATAVFGSQFDSTRQEPGDLTAGGQIRKNFEKFRMQWVVVFILVLAAFVTGLTVGFSQNTSNNNESDPSISTQNSDIKSSLDDDNGDQLPSLLPWRKLGNDIILEKEIPDDGIGVRYWISMSSDGSIVAIGYPYADGDGNRSENDTLFRSGLARVYHWDPIKEDFQQRGNNIYGVAKDDWFGSSVALSGDGLILAIGAKHNGKNGVHSGHVRVYRWTTATNLFNTDNDDEGSWIQRGNTINGEARADLSGSSLALSHDGSIVAIGAPNNDGFCAANPLAGHVRVYEWKHVVSTNSTTNTWIQRGADLDGEGAGDRFGTSVALSDDGSTIAIGGPYHNRNNVLQQSGYVRIFHWNHIEQNWWNTNQQQQQQQQINGDARHGLLGDSISISGNGSILAIGAPTSQETNDAQRPGHVRVYESSPSNDNNTDTTTVSWIEKGNDIEGPKVSVVLSGDGSTLALVLNDEATNGRAIFVYEWNHQEQTWSIRRQNKKGEGPLMEEEKNSDNNIAATTTGIPGYAVALSENGSRMILATSYCNNFNAIDCVHKQPYLSVYEWMDEDDSSDGNDDDGNQV